MTPMTANKTDGALISIVDDEGYVRESLGSLIRSEGYKVKEYESAEDYLVLGQWDETACLILDVRLPEMNGLELQRHLAEAQNARSIIFISGHASGNERTSAMMAGAITFLRKPFSDEALLKAVRESITRGVARDVAHGKPGDKLCPSCHESAQVAGIPEYLTSEYDGIRASTVEMIETLHPG